jgi:hypothetical protein
MENEDQWRGDRQDIKTGILSKTWSNSSKNKLVSEATMKKTIVGSSMVPCSISIELSFVSPLEACKSERPLFRSV